MEIPFQFLTADLIVAVILADKPVIEAAAILATGNEYNCKWGLDM